MKVAFVRGGFLNNFEGQNYTNLGKDIKLTGICSHHTIHKKYKFPLKTLHSLFDLGFPTWIANRTLGDRQILFGLEKAVIGFDVVHTADPHYYYSYQLAKMRKAGQIKCLLATSWETIPFNNESTNAKKRIKQFSIKYVDKFICYSERAKNCLIKEGVKSEKITVIRLGIDLTRFGRKVDKVRQSLPAGRQVYKVSKVRVLFVGRDVPEKGLSDLRYSIKCLIEQGYNLQLIVASNVPYEKMPEVYSLADIFVMPSKTTKTWEEQYGMVLMEAMASGLPIVAYKSGAIPELLGRAGILIPEGNVTKLSNALKDLTVSKEKRKNLGRLARKRAEKLFDSKKFSLEVGKVYKQVYFSL